MTRSDVIERINLTRIAAIVGAIVVSWGLLVAAKDAAESHFVTRYDMAKRDSTAAVQAVRDEVFQQRVTRFIEYSLCKERKQPGEYCLRPDRP